MASAAFGAEISPAVESGLDLTVYDNFGYNSSPPLPAISGRPAVGTTTVEQVSQDFDSQPLFNMYEDFIVEYTGFITSPVTANIVFYPYADDGTKLYLDGVLVDNNWVDKGGGGNPTAPQAFVAGQSKQFHFWFYENGGGAWVELYWNIGNGIELVPASAFTKTATVSTTTTTTLPPYFNPVTNLTATPAEDGGVDLAWDAPEASNLEIYAYTVTFFDLNNGAESGGWGVWTDRTSIRLGPWMWSGTTDFGEVRFKIRPGTVGCFAPSSEPCQYGPEQSADTVVSIATTTTTTTTTTLPPTTTTTTTEPPVATTTTTTTTVPVQTTVLQQAEQPQTTTTTSTSTVPVTTTTLPPEEKAPVPAASVIAEIKTAAALAELVDTVDLKEIKPDQAVALITNDAFVELPTDKLEAVFESIPVDELSAEQEAALVETLTDAPTEVKETFEATVDVYAEGLDEYVPVGSTVDVATRRTVIAVTTVLSTVTAAGAAPGASGGQPSGGGSSGGSGGSGGGSKTADDSNKLARKEEEEESEEAGGLEGPEDREKNLNTKNSIYRYNEDGSKEFSIMGLVKKFLKETAALAFTFAGSAIMFVTLSGDTRRIAIIATGAAVFVHYVHVMLENDEE